MSSGGKILGGSEFVYLTDMYGFFVFRKSVSCF